MIAANTEFSISREALDLGLTGAYATISGLTNRDTDPEFESYAAGLLPSLRESYGREGFVRSDPVLAGFRDLHTRIGRSNRKYVSSPEALVSRFARTGSLPHVNLLVDIYNLVSLETRLALGAHDLKRVSGGISLRLTSGDESFVPLGADAPQPVLQGEYGYVDDANDVICRMEVLQVEKTKIENGSTDVFYIVQGHPNTSSDYVEEGLERLIELTTRYCGGSQRILYTPSSR